MSILKAGKPRENLRAQSFREEMAQGKKNVKFSMNIPRALHAEFRKKSFLADKDMKDILLDAIRKYVNEN